MNEAFIAYLASGQQQQQTEVNEKQLTAFSVIRPPGKTQPITKEMAEGTNRRITK